MYSWSAGSVSIRNHSLITHKKKATKQDSSFCHNQISFQLSVSAFTSDFWQWTYYINTVLVTFPWTEISNIPRKQYYAIHPVYSSLPSLFPPYVQFGLSSLWRFFSIPPPSSEKKLKKCFNKKLQSNLWSDLMQQKDAHLNNQLSTKTNATTPPPKPPKKGERKGNKEIETADRHLT